MTVFMLDNHVCVELALVDCVFAVLLLAFTLISFDGKLLVASY
jgi:hypothetical protein